MEEKILISVIVPVYNVEKYLKRCIESILQQTFKEFELLLIDDGSTDLSGKICDESSEDDKRIIVYHKKNGGLSDARNYGINRAKGKYVTFIDSDDYIGPTFLEYLHKSCQKYNAMIAVGASFFSYSEDLDCFNEHENSTFECYTSEEAIKEICLNKKFGMSAWGKLYDKKLFDSIQFPIGVLYEDLQTTPYLIHKCNKIVYCQGATYYWYQRKGSIMHSYNYKNNVWYEAADQFVKFVMLNYSDLYEYAICRYVNDSFWNVVQRIALTDNCYNNIIYAREQCCFYWKKGLKNKYLKARKKINVLLMLISPRCYILIYRFYWRFLKKQKELH